MNLLTQKETDSFSGKKGFLERRGIHRSMGRNHASLILYGGNEGPAQRGGNLSARMATGPH